MNKHIIKQKKIDAHELKMRYIATQALNDLFYEHLLTVQQTPVRCHVDVCFTADSHTYDVEVKTRNKDIKSSPYIELKHSKLQNMKKDHDNDTLIYMVIVNKKDAYFFNLSKIDWKKIKSFMWKIKKIQYLEDSEYEVVPAYKIPLELACYQLNIEEYFTKYAILEQTKKSKSVS